MIQVSSKHLLHYFLTIHSFLSIYYLKQHCQTSNSVGQLSLVSSLVAEQFHQVV
uniref:Unkown protein n=1 Tax=Riptortus pedestris TaxID=329032 RepID=R4WTZ4_RIPPE|nr:unkown protein [Riptortus pedestris]